MHSYLIIDISAIQLYDDFSISIDQIFLYFSSFGPMPFLQGSEYDNYITFRDVNPQMGVLLLH